MLRTLLFTVALFLVAVSAGRTQTRIGDLTILEGEIPVRLVGYGLVVGLDGTGDRSLGSWTTPSPTVRSVVNLLSRFQIEIPSERLRLHNVAAVLVTAEISPYMRPGARFEVQVSALGDATSLRGGTLWMTPLVSDPDTAPVATAQGPVFVDTDETVHRYGSHGNSGRINQGGILEVRLSPPGSAEPRLLLNKPDLSTASRITTAINSALGDGTARTEDPGAIALSFASSEADTLARYLAAVDTLLVEPRRPARVLINAREGTVVAGGDVRVGPAVVSHHGLTLQIGGGPAAGGRGDVGLIQTEEGVSVQDIAAGLHSAGAAPDEIATVFDMLHAAGALQAEVVIR